MIKRYISKLCRSVRRSFEYLCNLDNQEAVKGIADVVGVGPLSKEEKAEREIEILLSGVKPEDRDKELRHLKRLRLEVDPLDGDDQIPNDCIRSVKIGKIPTKSE